MEHGEQRAILCCKTAGHSVAIFELLGKTQSKCLLRVLFVSGGLHRRRKRPKSNLISLSTTQPSKSSIAKRLETAGKTGAECTIAYQLSSSLNKHSPAAVLCGVGHRELYLHMRSIACLAPLAQ